MRTREGMKIAKAKGRLRGKVPKPRVKQEAHLVALHKAGEHTSAELAELFGVARSTVYRAIERAALLGTTRRHARYYSTKYLRLQCCDHGSVCYSVSSTLPLVE